MFDLPAAVPSMGTRRVLFIPTAADLDAITKAELTNAVNLSCYLTRSGGWNPSGDQATIQDSRLCSIQDFEQPGVETRGLEIQYTFNLNEPDEDKARLALPKGATGVLVHGMQIDEDQESLDTGDWYEAVRVRMGMQNVIQVEDNAVDRIRQKAFITSTWHSFKQIAA